MVRERWLHLGRHARAGTSSRVRPRRADRPAPDGAEGLPRAQPRADDPRLRRPRVLRRAQPARGHAGHVHLLELDVVIGRATCWSPCTDRSTPSSRSSTRSWRHAACWTESRRALSARVAGRVRVCRRVGSRATSACAWSARWPSEFPDSRRGSWRATSATPRSLLEEMFLLRHELMTVRTMAAQAARHLRPDEQPRRPRRPGRRRAVRRTTSPTSSTACAASPTASASSCSA